MEDYITSERMRNEEKRAVANGVSIETLMENAGKGVAETINKYYGPVQGKNIVAILGKGNNGGDGSVAARHLSEMGAKVKAVLLADPGNIRTSEARNNWNKLKSTNIDAVIATDNFALDKQANQIENADIVIAAIFGTGIKGSIRDPEAHAIRLINASKGVKIAVDIPSGLDPDTGEIKNPTVKVDLTVTMHKPKLGLKGKEIVTGKVVTVQIGIGP